MKLTYGECNSWKDVIVSVVVFVVVLTIIIAVVRVSK